MGRAENLRPGCAGIIANEHRAGALCGRGGDGGVKPGLTVGRTDQRCRRSIGQAYAGANAGKGRPGIGAQIKPQRRAGTGCVLLLEGCGKDPSAARLHANDAQSCQRSGANGGPGGAAIGAAQQSGLQTAAKGITAGIAHQPVINNADTSDQRVVGRVQR